MSTRRMQRKGRDLQAKPIHHAGDLQKSMDGFQSRGEYGEVLIPSAHFYFIYMFTETDHSQGPFAEQRHRTAGQTVSDLSDLA